MSDEELLGELRERVIHYFLDVLILDALNDSRNPISGRDLINFIHKRFGVLIDSGIIYSMLLAMERKDLIRGFSKEVLEKRTRRFYELSETGKKVSEDLMNNGQEIINFMKLLFKGNAKLILH